MVNVYHPLSHSFLYPFLSIVFKNFISDYHDTSFYCFSLPVTYIMMFFTKFRLLAFRFSFLYFFWSFPTIILDYISQWPIYILWLLFYCSYFLLIYYLASFFFNFMPMSFMYTFPSAITYYFFLVPSHWVIVVILEKIMVAIVISSSE